VKKLDFWYEFASTYSYPAAMRIEELAKAAGVAVAWRPFLLGPIFKAQGWNDSPFNLQVLKGRYMWRDLTRICEERGLPKFHIPANFPQHSLGAARVALALDDAARPAFSRAVYLAEFADGLDIGDADVLEAILQKLGYDPRVFLSRASTPEIKDRLRANTDEAQRLGIFGAPTFVLEDGEMFWGNDRLEQAIEWAKRR
jgi:2-hydroxychromene-2-carboxylate isomerase